MNKLHTLDTESPSIIGPRDPLTYEVLNTNKILPCLLICDHASAAIPESLNNLGLSKEDLRSHIAYDIGAASVTRNISKNLNAPAILSGYSRLVIDCNRSLRDPVSIPKKSEQTLIPRNQYLSTANQESRQTEIYEPYHQAITNTVSHLIGKRPPALFSIHSFTQTYKDYLRPWDVGVLWNKDPRIAAPLIDILRAQGLNVGDNEPYSGKNFAHTIDIHGGIAGLANVAVEIRQDQVSNPEGIRRWSNILTEIFLKILKLDGVNEVRHYL